MHKWNRAVGDASILLLSLAMAIGPLARLWSPMRRFLPGNVQVGSIVDIADNVIDLQIAVGVETSTLVTGGDTYGQILGDGFDADDRGAVVSLPGPLDEILFNHPDDDPGAGVYAAPPGHLDELGQVLLQAGVERPARATSRKWSSTAAVGANRS